MPWKFGQIGRFEMRTKGGHVMSLDYPMSAFHRGTMK